MGTWRSKKIKARHKELSHSFPIKSISFPTNIQKNVLRKCTFCFQVQKRTILLESDNIDLDLISWIHLQLLPPLRDDISAMINFASKEKEGKRDSVLNPFFPRSRNSINNPLLLLGFAGKGDPHTRSVACTFPSPIPAIWDLLCAPRIFTHFEK